MKLLITGGLGFIGSCLAKELISKGHEVRILDNLFKPLEEDDFIKSFVNEKKFKIKIEKGNWAEGELILGDARTPNICDEACKNVNAVIHCAAIHSLKDIANDLRTAVDINIQGTLNILKASQKSKVQRFIYMSTAKVYGEPEKLPSNENDFIFPMETYALTKSVGETYMKLFHEKYGIETISLRPFSVYGPRQNLNTGYIGMIIKALLGTRKPEIPGTPDFLRDFTYIDDLVMITLKALFNKDLIHDVFNVGSETSKSLMDLINISEKLSGQKINSTFLPPKAVTITKTQADMDKVEKLLGYKPKVHLEEGLKNTLNYFLKIN